MLPGWRNLVLGAIGFAGVLAVLWYIVNWWTRAPPELPNTLSLSAAWGEAIDKFGIEPVFPPEEDLTVGDVLAIVLQDDDPLPELRSDKRQEAPKIDFRTPFLKRSVKIGHVDVRHVLEEAYSKLSTFPALAAAPAPAAAKAADDKAASTEPKLPLPASVARQFTKEVLETDLPRAAFASLKSDASSKAAGSVSANDRAAASVGGSTQGYEEFHLSEVSTYGLPSARALEQLKIYCQDTSTKDDCVDSTIRRHLQPVIGDRVFTKYFDPQGNEINAVQVGLVIVNRVYLARSIVHLRRQGQAKSNSVSLSPFSSLGGTAQNAAPGQPAAVAPAAGAATAGSDDALKKRIDELEKKVAAMRTGAGISADSSASAESAFDTGRLDRPVAFGFRYVRFDPAKDNKTSGEKR
jgi:hypothetical protein